MQFYEKGLKDPSRVHFYPAFRNAGGLLYRPICAGEFFCGPEYEVRRDQYPSFLLLYVAEGEIYAGGETARAGEILLIDCYRPHRYGTKTSAHTLWLHFDGEPARQAFETVRREKGEKFFCPPEAAESLRRILEMIRTAEDEYALSGEIYRLLCLLVRPALPEEKKPDRIGEAMRFFREHYAEPVGVEDAAKSVSLSPSYFSRLFRAASGLSPYEYLLGVRLEKAKEMLLETTVPVSEVAYRTGFGSDANFIAFFRRETGISPLRFRHMGF